MGGLIGDEVAVAVVGILEVVGIGVVEGADDTVISLIGEGELAAVAVVDGGEVHERKAVIGGMGEWRVGEGGGGEGVAFVGVIGAVVGLAEALDTFEDVGAGAEWSLEAVGAVGTVGEGGLGIEAVFGELLLLGAVEDEDILDGLYGLVGVGIILGAAEFDAGGGGGGEAGGGGGGWEVGDAIGEVVLDVVEAIVAGGEELFGDGMGEVGVLHLVAEGVGDGIEVPSEGGGEGGCGGIILAGVAVDVDVVAGGDLVPLFGIGGVAEAVVTAVGGDNGPEKFVEVRSLWVVVAPDLPAGLVIGVVAGGGCLGVIGGEEGVTGTIEDEAEGVGMVDVGGSAVVFGGDAGADDADGG